MPAEKRSSFTKFREPRALASLVGMSNPLSDALVNWQIASHEKLWLIVKGTATIGHAGRLFFSEAGTLFLSKPGESHAVWNPNAAARIWVLTFRISSAGTMELSEMLELPPERRIITLSPRQQRLFRDVFLKIASESSKGGSLGAAAASAWLTIQLVTVMRWLVGQRDEPIKGGAEVDPQCFALWQKIHEHAHQATSAEPMLFSKDASYDSLRHRFRRTFGISPRGLLVRLRMNRAKELLRTSSDISIKELAQELGYTKQHEFTRAFHRFFGMSPSRLKRERAVSQVTKWLPVRQQYFSTSTKDKLRAVV